ncbi:unnamed protein product [Spodoptera exigua]|nr:unnamed protein product [Spodoptera exigua]
MCCGGGGGCGGGCGSAIGNGLYIVEKLASFFALTAVVICLIITLFIMLGLGVGLGYNYCFVDMKAGKLPGHYSYPHNLRYPYYRRSGEQGQDMTVVDRAAEIERQNDELRKPPIRPGFDSSLKAQGSERPLRQEVGIFDRVSNIYTNRTAEEYDSLKEEDVSNDNATEVDIYETQTDNVTASSEVTEYTETVTTTETVETEGTTEIVDTTDTTETTEGKTEDMYSLDDPTPEPVFPDEKRRVKKLVIPISGLDLTSVLLGPISGDLVALKARMNATCRALECGSDSAVKHRYSSSTDPPRLPMSNYKFGIANPP